MSEEQVTETEAPQVSQSPLDSIMEAAKLVQFDEAPEEEAAPEEAQETATEEPVAAQEEPEQESAPKRAKALAEMIRREKKLKQQAIELQSKKESTNAAMEDLEKFKLDPIKYLEEKNPDFYSEYTQRKLNDGQPTPAEDIRKLREELQELKNNNEALRNQTIKQTQEKIIQNARAEIKELLQNDDYELTRLIGNGEDEILNLIGLHFNQTGEDLTIKEAAAMIESELESRMERLSEAKKLKSRLGGKKGATDKKQSHAGTRTLSNTMTSSAAPVDLSGMDDYDALQHLAKTLDWPAAD